VDVSFQQLYFASRLCRRGKRKGLACQRYEARLIDQLFDTQRALHLNQWQAKPTRCFVAHNGSKPREIHAAHYADRVVHHYLVPRLEAIIEQKFIYDSAANQKGKGTHFAVQRLQTMMRQYDAELKSGQAVFYMQLDVFNFFYSIDKPCLLAILARHLKKAIQQKKIRRQTARDYYDLARQILKRSGYVMTKSGQEKLKQLPQFKRLHALNQDKGLAIGNLSSQFFANVYLNEFDQFIKHQLKIKHYVRYVDDFIILHTDEAQLKAWQLEISQFLEQQLKLRLKEEKIIRSVQQGADFLGYIIRPHYKLVRRRVLSHFYQKLKHWQQRWVKQENQQSVIDLNEAARGELHSLVASYIGHLKHAQAQKAWQQKIVEFPWLASLFNFTGGSLQHKLWLKSAQSFNEQRYFFERHYPKSHLIIQKGYYWVLNESAFNALPHVFRQQKSIKQGQDLSEAYYEIPQQLLAALVRYYQCQAIAYILVVQSGYVHHRLRQRKLSLMVMP